MSPTKVSNYRTGHRECGCYPFPNGLGSGYQHNWPCGGDVFLARFASNMSTHDTQTYPRIWPLKTAFHSGGATILKDLFNAANNDPPRPNNLQRFHLMATPTTFS